MGIQYFDMFIDQIRKKICFMSHNVHERVHNYERLFPKSSFDMTRELIKNFIIIYHVIKNFLVKGIFQ